MKNSRKFRFKKLVRDDIVTQMKNIGAKPTYRVLEMDEYIKELKEKLKEESGELKEQLESKKLMKELADVQEVLDKLMMAIIKNRHDLPRFKNFDYDLSGYISLLLDGIKSLNMEESFGSIEYYLALIQHSVVNIVYVLGYSVDDLQKFQEEKNEKAGSFDLKIYLEHVECLLDNPYIPYYEANPDRYPEIKE